jgi:hypothetical protein
MMQLKRLAIALLCLAASPALAAQPCVLSLSGALSQTPLNYDPFQVGAATATISFTIQNRGDGCTAAFAFFKVGDPQASFGGATLSYQVTASGIPIVHQHPRARDTLHGATHAGTLTVSANTTIQATATISVPAGQMAGPGAYTDALTLGVYNSASGVYQKSFETPFTVSVGVNSLATLAIKGGGKSVTMDFGDFVEGAIRTVTLTAYSNQGCHLTVSSDNAGFMKPVNAAAAAEGWRVPYTVKVFDKVSFDLSTQHTVSLSPTATPVTGLDIPVAVTVGSIKGQRAGTYRDVITIAIDPGA